MYRQPMKAQNEVTIEIKHRIPSWISILGAVALAVAGAIAAGGFVATPFPAAAEIQSSIVRGGKLYDK